MNDPLMGSNGYKIDVLCLLICHKGQGDIQRLRLLIVPRRNRSLNTSWAVGLTYWIVYVHFFYFGICNYIYICLDTSYHFLALSLLLKYSLFFQVLLY